MDSLPNELIKEILYPVFHVPDEMLHDVSSVSPFFRPSYQPCSLQLLVCKRWMIIGTPLLYRIVVVRSKAQACALEHTLRQNKEFGALIQKLRVEGGYGAAMRTIITSSPNIRDLGLSLDLRSSDSVKGLLSSLSGINPSCLTILDPLNKETGTNAPVRQLSEKLIACFRTWSNLVGLGFRGSRKGWPLIQSGLIFQYEIFLPLNIYDSPFRDICNGLVHAPNVQTITIPGGAALGFHNGIEILARNRSLQKIWLACPEEDSPYCGIAQLKELCARVNPRDIVALKLPRTLVIHRHSDLFPLH